MPDNLNIYGQIYPDAAGIKAKDTNGNTLTFYRPQGTKSIIENGQGIDVAAYATVDVNVSGGSGGGVYQSKTINPSEQQQNVTPDSGYDALSGVTVTAIASDYIGSAIPTRSSADLSVSGANVTVPSGFYGAQVSAAVASGTEGTPIATKGTVSNHSVTVTPSVTNTAGYISGGTKTGTGVTVQASELVSGSETKNANGTYDVTNLEEIVVDVPNSYSASDEGKVVSNGALVSQSSSSTTQNGTVDTTLINSLSVNVPQNTLVVTLTWDDEEGMWVPDCTYAEAYAALSAGKAVTAVVTPTSDYLNPAAKIHYSLADGCFVIEVFTDIATVNGDYYDTSLWVLYYWGSNFYEDDESHFLYNTVDTDATSSDVLSGKTFYNANGSQTGSIQTKTASDLTASGSVITVPVGYYSASASKAVAAGSVAVPNKTITVNPTISVSTAGVITASVAESSNVSPTVAAGYVTTGTQGTMSLSGSSTFSLTTQAAATITPSETQQTAVASQRYTTGNVVVAAISADYVGSSVTRRSSADLTASGSAITAPAGYYASAASKTVSAGTAGTPTATKGTVSNHSISIAPSVTNTTGWITGSTKSGTAVTVSASELVSGTSTISSNGTYDVTNYATASVSIPYVTYYTGTAAPTAGLGSNNDIYLQTS